jgi:hypothetical protein
MRHLKMPTYSFVVLTFILIIVDTLLAFASVKLLPAGNSGVAFLFPAIAFMIIFTLWFGGYGAIAAYVGTLVGSGLLVSETLANNLPLALLWAVNGLLQVAIPLVAVKRLDVDIAIGNRRDLAIVILFAVVLNNLAGAVWAGMSMGLIDGMQAIGSVAVPWFAGNVIVCLVLVPAALWLFTPRVQGSRLFVKNYWD